MKRRTFLPSPTPVSTPRSSPARARTTTERTLGLHPSAAVVRVCVRACVHSFHVARDRPSEHDAGACVDGTSYAKGRTSRAALGRDGDGDTSSNGVTDDSRRAKEKARNKGNVALDLAAGERAGRPSCSLSFRAEEADPDSQVSGNVVARISRLVGRRRRSGEFRNPYNPRAIPEAVENRLVLSTDAIENVDWRSLNVLYAE